MTRRIPHSLIPLPQSTCINDPDFADTAGIGVEDVNFEMRKVGEHSVNGPFGHSELDGHFGPWLAEALCAERMALTAELERRHALLLTSLRLHEHAQVPGGCERVRKVTFDGHVGSDCGSRAQSVASASSTCVSSVESDVPKHEFIHTGRADSTLACPSMRSKLRLRESHRKTQKSLLNSLGSTRAQSNSSLPEEGLLGFLARLVSGQRFELFFAGLIAANSLVMALEAQYEGVQSDFIVGSSGSGSQAEDEWPGAVEVFAILEVFFGTMFSVEVLLKMIVLQRRFVEKSRWNVFDLIVVTVWLLDKALDETVVVNPMILRLVRLARLLRLVRLVKTMEMFDALQVMIAAMRGSSSVLVWSLLLLFAMMTIFSLIFGTLLRDFVRDDRYDPETRVAVYRYFGSYTRSMVSMGQVTLANWVPVCRLLMDEVSEWYGLLVAAYVCVMSFGVVKVITGVFLHETFKCAASDDELMIIQKERAAQQHTAKMRRLFRAAAKDVGGVEDEDGQGTVCREEFLALLSKPQVKMWLAAMELSTEDVELLFTLCAQDGQDRISVTDLVQGTARLKGSARSMDLVQLLSVCRGIQRNVTSLERQLNDRVGG